MRPEFKTAQQSVDGLLGGLITCSRAFGARNARQFFPLLHRVDHVEDRQIHRHHHASDDHAQEHDHDRLHEAQESGDSRVDLGVIEVRDLRQHLVQSTGLFADRDHRDDHRREHVRLLQRCGDRIAARDARARFHDRIVNDAVAGRLRRDLEPVQNRHT
jgi:hypothetical protein